MGLMTGTGPLGRNPSGTFNFELPPPGRSLYLDPTPKRIRVEVEGETVADSRRAILLQESGLQPVYYFPREDVRLDLFEPTDRHTKCPTKGEASYYSIKVGERVVKNGAWYYPSPIEGAEPIADMIAFYWDRVDRWLEEDEEIFVHPRDPYDRVDAVRSSRHVQVAISGLVVAETRSPVLVFETGLPVRFYLPKGDVDLALFEPTSHHTRCPYKGIADYWSFTGGSGPKLVNVAWSYPEPLPGVAAIAGHIAFYHERVDLTVDGTKLSRP